MNSFLFRKLLIGVSVFAFAFFPTIKSNAQFLNKDALWTMRSTMYGEAPIDNYDDTRILKDSVINGINYSLFEFRNTLSAVREDNDKVFYKVLKHNFPDAGFDTLEHVLYDFNLIEGDSIQLELPSYSQFYKNNWVVREVDSILIGNKLKKRMFLEIPDSYGPGNSQYWIEDIGSTFGPLYFTGISEHEWEIELICYRLNETNLYGECLIVDAGKDTTYCTAQNINSLILGTTSKIANGKPPFKYAWECTYRLSDKLIFSASDFLNDTSLQSPVFKDIPVDQDWLKFTLTVTDSENNFAMDSLFVRFSRFAYLTGGGQSRFYIEKGDSILLTFPNSGIGGGIEPLSYYWRPKTFLSDPNSLVTWCKPDSSIQYEAFAIDSCGCVSGFEMAYDIRVLPESNDNNPEFAPIGAKWYFNYPNSTSNDYVVYESKKDSTIQGKVSRAIDVWLNNSRLVSREYVYQNGDSIFYYNRNCNSFFLLYNFSAKAGDTIIVHPAKFKPTKAFFSYDDSIPDFKYKILLVDSIQLSGQWIKRQKVTLLQDGLWGFSKPDGRDYYIINKIGSLAYFFGVQSGITPEDKLSICRCYSDSVFEFKNPLWASDCDLTLDALAYDFQTVYSNRVALFENSEKQIKALRIDSVKVDIDSVFYPFTTIQEVSENCFSPYKASWIGEKVVVKPDGTNLFFNRDGDTITLKTRARINETWIAFQRADDFRVKATVQSIEMETFLGLTDSVKTIILSVIDQNENMLEHPLNNLKLKISKTYGFVETLNFYLFPDMEVHDTMEKLENISLAGLTNPIAGVQNLTWFEVNDFQPGDELHVLEESSSWEGWNAEYGYSITNKANYKYLERTDYLDSIVYLIAIKQSIEKVTHESSSLEVLLDTVKSVIKVNPAFDKLPGEPIIDDIYLVVYNFYMTSGTILSKTIPKQYENFHAKNDSCWGMIIFDGCARNNTYFKGLGGPYYKCTNCCSLGGEERKLVYYKKGETEWGEKLVITGVSEIKSSDDLQFFPNPAASFVTISNPSNIQIKRIELTDFSGRVVQTWKAQELVESTLNIQHISPGIYLLKATTAKGIKTGKLVVQ